MYDEVHQMGKMLKNSRHTYDKDKNVVPPVAALSEGVQLALEKDIDALLDKSGFYLDACNIFPKKPLWKYNKDDPKTWMSHEKFIYSHLVTKTSRYFKRRGK